jgi:hypothetical protein
MKCSTPGNTSRSTKAGRLQIRVPPSAHNFKSANRSIENPTIVQRNLISRAFKVERNFKAPLLRISTEKRPTIPTLNDSMKLNDLPQVGKRFKFLIGDINQYQSRIQQSRDQVNQMLFSKPEFKNTSFEKYILSKEKPLDTTAKEYKINLTTKHCRLNDSQIQLERFATPQHKIPRNIDIFIKEKDLNLKKKLDVISKSNENIENEALLSAATKKASTLGSTFKNILTGVKIRGTIQGLKGRGTARHSILQRNAEILSIRKQIDESTEVFKTNFNQKLLVEAFYYNLKLNNKAIVVRILNLHPAFLNQSDQCGKYPIHYAVNRSMLKMTKILISFSSPIDVKDRLGNSPLDYAYSIKNSKIIKVS